MSDGFEKLAPYTDLAIEMAAKRERLLHKRSELRDIMIRIERDIRSIDVALALANRKAAPRGNGKTTIQQMALDVLASKPEGADAREILHMIRQHFGVEIERVSLSPQMSRMAAEGKVVRRGLTWFLGDAQ